LPFGEEIPETYGGRTPAQGYAATDGVRQKFTGYERDAETTLDYAQARYFASTQGRFTGVDPYSIVLETRDRADENPDGAKTKLFAYLRQPAKWNRYAYVTNNPLKFIDPNGEDLELTGETAQERADAFERVKNMVDPSARNLLYMQARRVHGRMHYFVRYRGDFASRGPLEAGVAAIIDSHTTTEYKIATTYTDKYGKTHSVADGGGGATLPAVFSPTGNVQIFVAPNAGEIGTQQMAMRRTPISNDGQPYVQDNVNVDAHEFGHGYAELIFCYAYDDKKRVGTDNNTFSKDKSLEFENYTRRRQGRNLRMAH